MVFSGGLAGPAWLGIGPVGLGIGLAGPGGLAGLGIGLGRVARSAWLGVRPTGLAASKASSGAGAVVGSPLAPLPAPLRDAARFGLADMSLGGNAHPF